MTKQIVCMRLVSIGSVGERCCIAPKGWIYLAEFAAFHAPVENQSLPCGRVLHRLPSWFNLWQMLWLLWAALSYQNPSHLETCWFNINCPLHMQGWFSAGCAVDLCWITSLRNWCMPQNRSSPLNGVLIYGSCLGWNISFSFQINQSPIISCMFVPKMKRVSIFICGAL